MSTQYNSSTPSIFQYKGEELTELQHNGVTIWNGLLEFAELGDGTYSASATTNVKGDIVIPSTYNGEKVTVIPDEGFSICGDITSVVIGDNVKSIGYEAFYCCTGITRVVIGSSVKSIGSSAFFLCNQLSDVYYKGTAEMWKEIKISSVSNDKLTNANLYYYSETKPTTEGNYWHYVDGEIMEWGCACENGHTWQGATCVTPMTCSVCGKTKGKPTGLHNWQGATCFTPITCSVCGATYGEASDHNWSDWVLDETTGIKHRECLSCGAKEKFTFSYELLSDGTYSVKALDGINISGVIEIPSTYNDIAVTQIAENGFEGEENITLVILPDSIVVIGDGAFDGCTSLSEVYYNGTEAEWANITIGDTNDKFNDMAIYYYSETEPTTEGNYWYKVDGYIFEWGIDYSKLFFIPLADDTYGVSAADDTISGTVTIPHQYYGKAVTRITEQGFSYCADITEVKLPNSITVIEEKAFASSGVESITIPKSVTNLGSECFYGSSIKNITFDKNSKLAEIPYYCFGSTPLKEIAIPDSVSCIGIKAFAGCGLLDSIEFGESSQLVRIDENAFYHCYYLKSISIPEGCLYIYDRAFSHCDVLEKVSLPASLVHLGYLAFGNCSEDLQITVGEGNAKYKYKGGCLIKILEDDTEEVAYGNQNSEIPSTASSIGAGAFYGNTYFAPIKIPLNITKIGSLAFGGKPVTVYVEATSKPNGWADDWRDDSVTVVWGYIEGGDFCSHSYGGWTTTVLPTCTKFGTMQRTCSICGDADILPIDPLGHDYETIVVEPTCTTDGYTTYTCKRCGHSYVGNYIEATGHDYETIVVEPTCIAKGYTRYTCSKCGHRYVGNYTTALGHEWDKGFVRIEPTCTTNGVRRHTCTRCGDTVDIGISALRHDWGEWRHVHPAECEIDGTDSRYCKRCGEEEIRNVPATGHDWDVEVEVVEPTCIDGGYTIHTCNACGETKWDNYTDPLGHNFVNGICTRCNSIVYYGVSAIPERYNSSFILGLDHQTPSNSHLNSISATPLEGEYIYYCAPTSFGDCAFAYNNFVGGFSLIIEGLALTNAGGKTEAYNIYKSNQANLGVNGAITITIKEMG